MKTYSTPFITVKTAILSALLLSCCYTALAQKKRRSWEISAAATQFNFSGAGQRYGVGITAEYYITKNISTRGSIIAGTNYFHISLAPFFWDYAHDLLHEKPAPRDASPRRPSHAFSKPLLFLAGLAFSDGIVYHMPLQKGLYFCPYIAPLQLQLCDPASSENPRPGIISTALGVGIKAYRKHLVLYAGAEYSRSLFITPRPGFGYSIQASVGYVIMQKKKRH